QAEDGIRDFHVTGVQTCALPISPESIVESVLITDATLDAPTPRTQMPFGSVVWPLGLVTRIAGSWLAPEPITLIPSMNTPSVVKIGRASCRERVKDAMDVGYL